MTVFLPQTFAAISDCRAHLDSLVDPDPAIVAYLTRYLNLTMCSEIEFIVTGLIHQRIEQGCDVSSVRFVKARARNAVRSARYREIKSVVAQFGPDYKRDFEQRAYKILNEDMIGKLGVAVGKRDSTAHRGPPDITFQELESAYEVAETVMGVVDSVLKR